jgi:hypothetical protein
MLKRLREVKPAFGSMVISEFWSFWRKTNQASSKKVKDTVLDDAWWESVDLTIKIMDPIISLLQFADIDKPILGEVYEGWDSMIESVRTLFYRMSPLSMGHHQRSFSPPYRIFLSTGGIRIAHLFIAWLTH